MVHKEEFVRQLIEMNPSKCTLAIFFRSPTDEQYRVRGVSLIKFTYFDSCLVFVDFDTFSLIKEKYIFGFKCFHFDFPANI